MSQTKAQLIQPIGIVTAGGVVVTGVVTASSFDGDVVGTATSIISGGNLNLGDVNATTFSGDFTGNATGINTGADIKVGSFTATNFTGDFTGTATSMMRGTGFKAGAVNATGFHVSGTSAGTITGNVTGDVTGDVTGVSTGNVTGNVTGNITGYAKSVTSGANIHVGVLTAITFSGDGSNLAGIAATNFNTQVVPGSTFSINVTASGSSNYTLSGTDRSGSVSGSDPTVTVEIGDTLNFVVDASGHPFYIRVSDGGANVSTPAATNQGTQSGTVSWTPNTAGTYYYQCGNHAGMIGTITVTATTTIDLSAGNCITFNQSANTTVSFANTSEAMDVFILRNGGSGSITWPDSIRWDGGSAPTLYSDADVGNEWNQIQLLTRDSGVTWYGWENASFEGGLGLFIWGAASWGRIGNNDLVDRSSPIQIGTELTWSKLAQGDMQNNQSGAIKTDGTLWTWGQNEFGVLGQNTNDANVSSPTQVGTDTTWNEICIGHDITSIATKTNGSLWVWGNNNNGILGQNQPYPGLNGASSPTQVPGTWETNRYSITSSAYHVAAIKSGKLFAWGYGGLGGLGLNNEVARSSPTQVGTETTWSSVSGSYYSMTAIKTNGTLWTWGNNSEGKLGHNQASTQYSSPTQIPGTDWKQSTISNYFAGAVKTTGELWVWGNGIQLGVSNNTSRSSPIQVPGTTWNAVTSSDSVMLATKTDGTLWSWGENYSGSLGVNVNNNRSSPMQIPGSWNTTQLLNSRRGFGALKSP